MFFISYTYPNIINLRVINYSFVSYSNVNITYLDNTLLLWISNIMTLIIVVNQIAYEATKMIAAHLACKTAMALVQW